MRKSLIGLAVIATAIGAPVLAADMPLKSGAPPSAYDWTGCYVGVNGGYGWNRGSSSYQDPNTTADPINGILSSGGGGNVFVPIPSDTRGSGGLGGVGAGCNWQRQQWVFGIEGDFDWARISGSRTTIGPDTLLGPGFYAIGPVAGGSGTGVANEQVSLQWLSTVRARLGFTVEDRLLFFATAGLALAGVNSQGSVSLNFPGISPTIWSGSNATVRGGVAVGGGLEWAFSGRWTLKTEYLWYDLGRVSHSLNCTVAGGPCSPIFFFPTLGNTTSSVSGSMARVGINYKFW